MSNIKTLEDYKRENARRQREYNARKKSELRSAKQALHDEAVLVDSIKLADSFGDPMAREIIQRSSGLSVSQLAQFFQARAAMYKIARAPKRVTKKTAGVEQVTPAAQN
jgi:hypothetical protein